MPAPRKYRRPRRSLSSVHEEKSPKWWLTALILFSLLAHVLVVLIFVFIGRHTPKFTLTPQKAPLPEVNLTLEPPPMRPAFIPTDPNANIPQQNSPLISDNNSKLQSLNRTSRRDKSLLPDVTGRKDHSADLHQRPPSPASRPQTPTPPKAQPQRTQPQPAPPNQAPRPNPPAPAKKPSENPDKTQGAAPTAKPAPTHEEDENGLPVLPPIPAPTLAEQTPQTQPVQQVRRKASPQSVPSFAVYQSDVAGQAGSAGENAPSAMASDLGRYKAKVYRAVGSRWYAKVADQLQVLGVGTVHITYTIYSDGHLEIRADPDAGNPALMLLHSISLNAMTEAAPFEPFSEAMKKEVGDSFTDDFSFSIYGN